MAVAAALVEAMREDVARRDPAGIVAGHRGDGVGGGKNMQP
jgi:hypothetical protein